MTRIERARPEQYEAVCAVIAEGDAVHEEALPDVFCKRKGPTRPRDYVLARMEGPDSAILVALEGEDDVVGILEIVMKPHPERDGLVSRRLALVDGVVVRADRRGRGIGTKLMAHAVAWATEQGATALELTVWATNPAAKRLYESLGFVTRLVRMERPLLPKGGAPIPRNGGPT